MDVAKAAIDRYFEDRNANFQKHPKRAGKKIWGSERELYPVHAITRKSFRDMTRKLSVTESHRLAQFRGTLSRKKSSVASAN